MGDESGDRKWWFVVGERYAAWIEKQYVAEGSKTQVFGYARKVPYLVVTGAQVPTTFTPDLPAVSDLQLDMGIRIPVLRDWHGNTPANGQAAYTPPVVELPVRNPDSSLATVPPPLPRTAHSSPAYPPLPHHQPTHPPWSNGRYATTSAAFASCRRCGRAPLTYPPTPCR